jgi:hypothetical protein
MKTTYCSVILVALRPGVGLSVVGGSWLVRVGLGDAVEVGPAVKWQAGSEGRISTLKCQYGWDHTRLDGTEGAEPRPGTGCWPTA